VWYSWPVLRRRMSRVSSDMGTTEITGLAGVARAQIDDAGRVEDQDEDEEDEEDEEEEEAVKVDEEKSVCVCVLLLLLLACRCSLVSVGLLRPTRVRMKRNRAGDT